MPDLNPYEAPQSELSSSKQDDWSAHEKPWPYPGIVPYAISTQVSSIVSWLVIQVVIIRHEGTTRLLLQALAWGIVISIPVLIGIAVRYRIAWLLAIEMFLIGLICILFVGK